MDHFNFVTITELISASKFTHIQYTVAAFYWFFSCQVMAPGDFVVVLLDETLYKTLHDELSSMCLYGDSTDRESDDVKA